MVRMSFRAGGALPHIEKTAKTGKSHRTGNSKKNPGGLQTPAFQRGWPERRRSPNTPKPPKQSPEKTAETRKSPRAGNSKKNPATFKSLRFKRVGPKSGAGPEAEKAQKRPRAKPKKNVIRPKSFGEFFSLKPAAASCPPGKRRPTAARGSRHEKGPSRRRGALPPRLTA